MLSCRAHITCIQWWWLGKWRAIYSGKVELVRWGGWLIGLGVDWEIAWNGSTPTRIAAVRRCVLSSMTDPHWSRPKRAPVEKWSWVIDNLTLIRKWWGNSEEWEFLAMHQNRCHNGGWWSCIKSRLVWVLLDAAWVVFLQLIVSYFNPCIGWVLALHVSAVHLWFTRYFIQTASINKCYPCFILNY